MLISWKDEKTTTEKMCVRDWLERYTPVLYTQPRKEVTNGAGRQNPVSLSPIYDMRYRFYYFHTAFNPRDCRT